MSLTAFVTGASGFVGANLVRELAGNGWRVVALVRESSPLEDLGDLDIELRVGDVTRRDSIMDALPPRADCVFHVAASTNVWSRRNAQQTAVNVQGTDNVVRATLHREADRLVHTSSFIVWGFQGGTITEESPRSENADWINYVRTKHAAEQRVMRAVSEEKLDAVVMNPAHILGPGDRHNWSRMIRMVDRQKLPGVPPGGGAFADVREVARAHVQAYHRGRRGERYLLGGEDVPFIDVVRMTGEILGRKVPRHASPAWLLRAVARLHQLKAFIDRKEPDLTPESVAMITRHLHCDSGKAQRELGYRLTPLRRLLEDTIDWLDERRLLRPREAP